MATTAAPGVSVPEAQRLMSEPTTLVLDVRTPGEYETAHIADAVNLPVDQLNHHLSDVVQAAGGTLMLVCQSGGRAERAASSLSDGGHHDLVVLDGGMNAWNAAGAPVESSGRDRWSLERQVRLVAGSLVLSSILASTKVPQAKWVAGFIGSGLTFAALSNTCAMGTALSKLPYNRGASCDVGAALAKLSQQ